MAEVKSANCPHGGRKLGAYPFDLANTQRTHGTCPACGKRCTVEYGKGKIKVSKGLEGD
mgnify:CR=1 FL=1